MIETNGNHVLVIECEEYAHSSINPCEEMTRLAKISDQVLENTQDLRPIIVLRFDPYGELSEEKTLEIKECIESIISLTHFECGDDRGIKLHEELFGYNERRKRKYKRESLTQVLTIEKINSDKRLSQEFRWTK